ncbi:MAG: tagatose 1,6-diphosphate aldolase [Anaerococcus sp.]|nr:tagatose 1,6-diphosphate aldolase [Anaerococcus sp.]
MKVSKEKLENLKQLINEEGAIAALAIDQRGSMEKMMGKANPDLNNLEGIETYKEMVSRELTPFASSILLDPIYGQKGIKARADGVGLILSYEQTGYDEYDEGRLPRLINFMSALKAKEMGANAIKTLLYYDVDDDKEVNDIKKRWVERVSYECQALGLPHFLEIITYDRNMDSEKSAEYAKVRPRKVNEAIKIFSDERYMVDVLKVETPTNMNFVEGLGKQEPVYSRQEAKKYFKEQAEATNLPFIFLSGGVSAELFQETLKLAKEAGSNFNGVLCGRATWKDSVDIYGKDANEAEEWLKTQGKDNIESLNAVIKETARSIFEKIEE